jgi:hypothetical protein
MVVQAVVALAPYNPPQDKAVQAQQTKVTAVVLVQMEALTMALAAVVVQGA